MNALFLHIGGDFVIRAEEVVAIIDIKDKKDQIQSRHSGRLFIIDNNENKSYVITESRDYLSPISSSTLKKRMEVSFS